MTNNLMLPKKREFGWALKLLSSDKTSITPMDNGQIEVIIEHDLIKGITTDMLEWWFRHFTMLTVEKDGVTYPAYHLWHAYDHISVTSNSDAPIQKDGFLRIHEAFQRNPKFEVNENARISALDSGNMSLIATKFEHTTMDLRHKFHDVPEGVIYHSRMVLGAKAGLMKPFINGFVMPRLFNTEKANA